MALFQLFLHLSSYRVVNMSDGAVVERRLRLSELSVLHVLNELLVLLFVFDADSTLPTADHDNTHANDGSHHPDNDVDNVDRSTVWVLVDIKQTSCLSGLVSCSVIVLIGTLILLKAAPLCLVPVVNVVVHVVIFRVMLRREEYFGGNITGITVLGIFASHLVSPNSTQDTFFKLFTHFTKLARLTILSRISVSSGVSITFTLPTLTHSVSSAVYTVKLTRIRVCSAGTLGTCPTLVTNTHALSSSCRTRTLPMSTTVTVPAFVVTLAEISVVWGYAITLSTATLSLLGTRAKEIGE